MWQVTFSGFFTILLVVILGMGTLSYPTLGEITEHNVNSNNLMTTIEESNPNFRKPIGGGCEPGFILNKNQCIDSDVFFDYSDDKPECNRPNIICNYLDEVIPFCGTGIEAGGGETSQACYSREHRVICESDSKLHACQINEPVEEETSDSDIGGGSEGGDNGDN
jgi:hypothetical protein